MDYDTLKHAARITQIAASIPQAPKPVTLVEVEAYCKVFTGGMPGWQVRQGKIIQVESNGRNQWDLAYAPMYAIRTDAVEALALETIAKAARTLDDLYSLNKMGV